ncbi:hypothetical protein BDE40_2945 [Litoreibacter halocynthiae]|uniref:Uncharacterized protein n=2 Tax=Litoreibacter halocynthiae TaxID=1242689 RepID=A0A4R7LET5_9RHOB|nr:hypothetical protein BDE40_2945 [Litoreibacter halocynthiae]
MDGDMNSAHPSPKRPRRALVVVFGACVAFLAGAAMIFGFGQSRPKSLSLSVHSHVAAPAVKRLVQNGRMVVELSTKGRNEGGPTTYGDRSDDLLQFELSWYDIVAKQTYSAQFELPAKKLSTFGDDKDHASIDIVSGPGADVKVTTPNPEALRLVGLRQTDKITPEMDAPVVLLELCAKPVAASQPLAQELAAGVEDWSRDRALEQRKRYLASNPAPRSRCAS